MLIVVFLILALLLTVVGFQGYPDEIAQDTNISAHKDDQPNDYFSVHLYSSF